MNIFSSLFSISSSSAFLAKGILETVGNILQSVLNVICQYIYFIAKWLLYFVDLIFCYIEQLAGLNMNTKSLDAMLDKNSDMVFNLLFSNSEQIARLIKNLVGVAIVLIIVFSIIAIIKGQFDTVKDGKQKVDVKYVITKTLKSVFLLIVTPFVALLSIVCANLLLKSLSLATNPNGAATISRNLFMASANSANKYRIYALEDNKIPILFDFSEAEAIMESQRGKSLTDAFKEYLQSDKNSIYKAYMDFQNSNHISFDEIKAPSSNVYKNYYKMYDRDTSYAEGGVEKYYQINAYQEEYLVMADIIDYATTTAVPVYIKTLDQVLESIKDISMTSPEKAGDIINDLCNTYKIKFVVPGSTSDTILNQQALNGMAGTSNSHWSIYNNNAYSVIRWTSRYYTPDPETSEPARVWDITYNHVKGATDERYGAVFLTTIEKTITVNNTNYSYYYPITLGSTEYFDSQYIQRNQMISAKGLFNSASEPTAIRISGDGSEVQFYRDVFDEIALGSAGDIFGMDYVQEEGGFFEGIINFFKTLFNPLRWFPNFKLDEEAMQVYYTKASEEVNSIEGGKLHIGYLFTDALTGAISANLYGLRLENLYAPASLNYLVLLVGSVMLIKICFLAVFALIKRSYDLFLIIIIYPATCATLPIDEGAGYNSWTEKFIEKLFLSYGLILGINFVLLLFPIISNIEFFSVASLARSEAVGRISKLFGPFLSIQQQAKILNVVTAVLFELVALSYLDKAKDGSPGIVATVSKIVNPNATDDLYTQNPGAMIIKMATDTATFIGKVVLVLSAAGSFATGALDMLTKKGRQDLKQRIKAKAPGSAILKEAHRKQEINEAKAERDAAKKDLKDSMTNGATPEEVQKKMEAYIKAQQGVNKTIKDGKKPEEAKKKGPEPDKPTGKNSPEPGGKLKTSESKPKEGEKKDGEKKDEDKSKDSGKNKKKNRK